MASSDHKRQLSAFIADLGWENLPPEAIMTRYIDFDDGHKFVHPGCVVVQVCASPAERCHTDDPYCLPFRQEPRKERTTRR